MNWLFYSLLAAVLWAFVNVIDKLTVEKYIKQPIIYLIFGGIASVFPAAFTLIVLGIENIHFWAITLAISTGVILISYTYFFFAALQKDDAPLAIAVFQLVPVFSIIWGRFLFHETFGFITYIGMAIVILSITLITIEVDFAQFKKSIRISGSVKLMIISSFLASIGYVIQKYLLTITNFETVFFWGRVGDVVSALCILLVPKIRKELLDCLKRIFGYVVAVSLFNELLNSTAIFLLIVAYSTGALSLVSTIAAVQPMFLLIIIKVINSVKPGLIPDSSDAKLFSKRAVLISFIVIGVYLISYA